MFTRKKIQAFIMLLAVAAPLLFFAGFLLQQKLIKNNMDEKLENTSLQTVTVKSVNIQWDLESNESIIDGKLFDIKSYTVNDDKVSLTGLYDTNEDSLDEQFSNFVQQKNSPSSPLGNAVIKFLFPPLYTNVTDQLCQITWQHIRQDLYSGHQEKRSQKYLSILTPPPKFIS